MIDMTPEARERLDNYLQRVRSELRGTRSGIADEVEQSVREHIEIALASAQTPVGTTQVAGVLDRLGPPERWLSDEERPMWRRAIAKLRSAPGDWRLAYVAFGLFLASMLLLPLGVGALLLIPAMLVSRAHVELSRDTGQPLGARRWLVYPAIALVLAVVTGLLIIGPPLPVMGLMLDDDFEPLLDIPHSKLGELRFLSGLGAVVFGSWWILLATFCAAFLRPIRFVFAPLLEGLRRKHFAVLAGIGAIVAAAGAALIYYRH
jgi:hypothetical protein